MLSAGALAWTLLHYLRNGEFTWLGAAFGVTFLLAFLGTGMIARHINNSNKKNV